MRGPNVRARHIPAAVGPDGFCQQGASVLPRPLRLTRSAEHRTVTRSGRRGTDGALTVHVLSPGVSATAPPAPTSGDPTVPARAGLVVGKVVGGAVVRHRVSRRLRHLLAERLAAMPAGTLVVVRAGPGAGTADLAVDLDGALRRASRPGRTSRTSHSGRAERRVVVEAPSGGSSR